MNLCQFLDQISKTALVPIVKEVQRLILTVPDQTTRFRESVEDLLCPQTIRDTEECPSRTALMKEPEQCSQASLAAYLTAVLTKDKTLQILYSALSAKEQDVLHYFMFQVGADFVTYRQIERAAAVHGGAAFRLGLTGLRRKGIIYTLRRQWGEVAYALPVDLHRSMYRVYLWQRNTEQLEYCSEPVRPISPHRAHVSEQLFQVLDYFRGQTESAIPLNQKQTIHKRYVRMLQGLVGEEDQPLMADIPLSVEERQAYSPYIALILDFLSAEGLLEWFEQEVRLNHAVVQQWMERSKIEITKRFLRHWLISLQPDQPWIRQYAGDIGQTFISDKNEVASRTSTSKWVYMLSVVERWEEEFQLPSVTELQQQLERAVLRPLEEMGILERGVTEQQEQVWRVCSVSEYPSTLWLQPDLEMLAPAVLPFRDLWTVTELFEVSSWQEMIVLKPSRKRVQLFLDRNGSLSDWLTECGRLASTPLPAVLEDKLRQWKTEYGKVNVSEVSMIEMSDKEMASVLLHWAEQEQMSVRALTPYVLVVPPEQKDAVLAFLDEKGLPCHHGEQQKEKRHVQPITPSLLAKSTMEKIPLRVESVFPDLEEAVPVWRELPAMWRKQFVNYHDKTKKDMLHRAAQYTLPVKFELSSGEICQVQPVEMKIENGSWLCVAEDSKSFALEDIERVQLLFPELG